ncbi:hypothetical protein [Haloferula sp.]
MTEHHGNLCAFIFSLVSGSPDYFDVYVFGPTFAIGPDNMDFNDDPD